MENEATPNDVERITTDQHALVIRDDGSIKQVWPSGGWSIYGDPLEAAQLGHALTRAAATAETYYKPQD